MYIKLQDKKVYVAVEVHLHVFLNLTVVTVPRPGLRQMSRMVSQSFPLAPCLSFVTAAVKPLYNAFRSTECEIVWHLTVHSVRGPEGITVPSTVLQGSVGTLTTSTLHHILLGRSNKGHGVEQDM